MGRYRILAELGRGGMGVVYRATDLSLNREVALKILPQDVSADPDRRRRFLKEAQTAAQLEHAHIGVIHEVGEADGLSFIAMELIRGEPLSQLVARGAMGPARALDLAAEIAEGLARAHEMGIVHRDLKPANVMITEDGHAKVIDFGLAKAAAGDSVSNDAATVAASTDFGVIKGTAAYMSPEQTRGERLDGRSDLFSFGVMLYQTLTGRLPFQAPSYVDTLHAITHDPVPPLTLSSSVISAEAQQDLQRLIDKCLAKDPAARYQTARDLVVDLRAMRRRLDAPATSTGQRVVEPEKTRSAGGGRTAIASALAVLVVAVGAYWWTHRAPSAPPPIVSSGRPSVAVLYFQNQTGSPQLDWLRTGITSMVVTDLSQSSEMDVLSTDRLYQILASLKRQNDAELSFDTIKEVARLAGARHVVVGNYVKAGETIRINITLQEAASGRIVTADHLEAAGEANLFPTVDDLTRRLQTHLAGTAAKPTALVSAPGAASGTPSADSGMYRDLSEVTTSSIDAYRAYAQGVTLLEAGRPRDAEPLLLQAISIDPNFALAMARLAAAESNLRRLDKRAEYARRALDHADRLAARDRYYLEGFYYTADEDTAERGIAAFQKLLALYPEHYAGRHNLATAEAQVWLFDEAVRLGEQLRQNAFVLPISLSNLIEAYASAGRLDEAKQVHAEIDRRFPNTAYSYRTTADFMGRLGKLDEARAAYDKAEAIAPGDPTMIHDRWGVAVLQDKWPEAEALAASLARTDDPFTRYAAVTDRATDELYHGRSASALRMFDDATQKPGPWGVTFDAMLHLLAARTRLALGQPARALPSAEAARQTVGQNLLMPVALGRAYSAIALMRLGRTSDAKTPLDQLGARAAAAPGTRMKYLMHHVAGILALDRRDTATAVSELTQAEALLPQNGNWQPPPQQPETWFALGSAYLAAGNDAEAEKRFARLASGVERASYPVEFVRSLYFLGQIAERRGDRDKAREYYRRFVGYWGDGDVDRERVADARKKMGQ
ncbi:MAG TPA: protein kinase [Vicinamibacterales bacterium]|nr:protein kinase [Vicinamibacterales bacterium]